MANKKLLNTGITLAIEGNLIDDSKLISQRIENKDQIISFGCIGVRRELIDWYIIEEAK